MTGTCCTRRVSQTVDWATKRSPPKKPRTGPGLECLAELTEDERALTAAADMAQAAFEEESVRFRGQQPGSTSAAAATSGAVLETGGTAAQAQMEAPLRALHQQAAGGAGQPLPREAVAAAAQGRTPEPAADCTRRAAPAAAAEQETPHEAATPWLPRLPADWRHLLPGGAAPSKPSKADSRDRERLQGQAGPCTAGRQASKDCGPPPEVEMQVLNDSSSLPGQAEKLLSADGQPLCESAAWTVRQVACCACYI